MLKEETEQRYALRDNGSVPAPVLGNAATSRMPVRDREEPELRWAVELESEARPTRAHGGSARLRVAKLTRPAGAVCGTLVTARRGPVSAAWPWRAMQSRDGAQ
jgi:hypothetical protein